MPLICQQLAPYMSATCSLYVSKHDRGPGLPRICPPIREERAGIRTIYVTNSDVCCFILFPSPPPLPPRRASILSTIRAPGSTIACVSTGQRIAP
eukprot:2944778-Rhodomonas_salina.2